MAVPVGIILVGHGVTASGMLAAAGKIVPSALNDVVAIDAGLGETPSLTDQVCEKLEAVDRGRGVLVITDLVGASPWGCVQRECNGHRSVVLSGLNLAMLLKLATLDRLQLEPIQLAHEVARSGHRSVTIDGALVGMVGEDEEEK